MKAPLINIYGGEFMIIFEIKVQYLGLFFSGNLIIMYTDRYESNGFLRFVMLLN